MTVIRRERKIDANMERLRRLLVEELQGSNAPGREPVIIIESESSKGPTHLYVIWSEWGDIPLDERSKVILNAFEEAMGIEFVLDVTLALGLRPDEAPRFGIEPKEYMEVSA